MRRREFVAIAAAAALEAQAPYQQGRGWKPLTRLDQWYAENNKGHEWFTAQSVSADGKVLKVESGSGPVLVNGPKGRTANLVSKDKFGDCEFYVEFMVPAGSNSGVYLQGLYEIQVFDSYGVTDLKTSDCGAIYHRWINEKPVGGSAPKVNASKRPGEWQSFHGWFRAPRFDAAGKKTENARFVRVLHNSVLVQENVEVEGPTRAHMQIAEAPVNPLMLQGDLGPVAYRNVHLRPPE
jgi:hypothetical protein